MLIPVPALIEEALYDAVQEQLAENRRRARQSQRGARYLLQGLLACKVCGYAFYGKPLSPSARKHRPRGYAYYRCVGTDSYRFGGHRVCANTQIRTDLVEIAVWHGVCQLLQDPRRLEREYHRRGHARPRGAKWETPESLRAQIAELQRGMARLIDGYAEGLIEKAEFEPRIKRMKQRVTVLEDQLQQLADEALQQRELELLIGQLEEFVTKVQRNLAAADWAMKREIIRALVRRVEIDKQEVTVVFRVGPDLSGQRPEKQSSQHCWRRSDSALRHTRMRVPKQLPFHDPGAQEVPDQPQELAIFDAPFQQGQEFPVMHGVKVRGNVALDDPEELLVLRGAPQDGAHSVHRAAIGSEAEGVVTKIRFVYGFEQHTDCFLYDPIANGRDAQGAYLAIAFRDVHPTNRSRCICLRPEFSGELLEILLRMLVKVSHGDAVTTRGHRARILCDIVMRQA
jgi:hypothetical protein